MSRIGITTLVLALAAPGVWAADGGLGGPVSGLLVDPGTRSIRPIIGLPGSAYAGDAAVTRVDYALGAPDGASALVQRDGSIYLLRRLAAGTPVWRTLKDDSTRLGAAAWSEDAQALALYLPDETRVELWKNLGADPTLSGSVDLTGTDGSLAALAVTSDGGTAFAAMTAEQGGSTLYLLKPGESPRMLAPLSSAGTLLVHGGALYATDRERGEILMLTGWDFNTSLKTIATPALGVTDPVGLGFAADRKTLWVADGASRQLLAIDVDQQKVLGTLDLDFQPTQLEKSGSVFLLARGEAGVRPAQVLDVNRGQVFFVPVSAAATAPPDSGI
jgi:hypothetical protein